MSEYELQAQDFADKYGVTLTINDEDYKKHFIDDVRPRAVYNCTLRRGRKSYTFDFGASYADPSEPTMYDVLAALVKSDPGSFEDFCAEYGMNMYDEDTYGYDRKSMRVYKALQKEYAGVERLFGDVMDELWEIQ